MNLLRLIVSTDRDRVQKKCTDSHITKAKTQIKLCIVEKVFTSPLTEIANFSTKYLELSKVYTDEGGIK